MAARTVDLSIPATPITGDQIRAIADILNLGHVEFEDIQRIDITPADVTVTVLHRNDDGHAHESTKGGDIATITITMPIRWG